MDESNTSCDTHQLDEAESRLPPRKRLLAGLKRQNVSSLPSTCEITSRIRELMIDGSSGQRLSVEEIVKATKSAALAAKKVAAEARSRAEEKATIAATAVSTSKNALDVLASLSEVGNTREDKYTKKFFRTKRHAVPVQILHRKKRNRSETDEEMARKLHRTMNSSPRILRTSDGRVRIPRKHRRSPISNIMEENTPIRVNNANATESVSYRRDKVGEKKVNQYNKTEVSKMDSTAENEEGEDSSKDEKVVEETVTVTRKRGRIKQKKLSLSLCAIRDRVNSIVDEPKGEGPAKRCNLFPDVPSTSDRVSYKVATKWHVKKFNSPDAMREAIPRNRYAQIRQTLQDQPC